jgi:hypothetical protein
LLRREIVPLKVSEPTPARLEDFRDFPQGPRERRFIADLTHARILQLEELGLSATHPEQRDGASRLCIRTFQLFSDSTLLLPCIMGT